MANPTFLSPAVLSALVFSLFPAGADAYTWAFQQTPQQCSNLTIAISGDGGKPPYRILIIPFGPTPLPNAIEARRIVDVPFPGTDAKVSFQLKYPANSQFVAVVSDASGFGSGGTSVAAQVTTSSDASCFDASANVSPPFFFSIDPQNQIVQCQDTRLYWTPSTVQGTPNFLGVIPGGQSFAIPRGAITDQTGLGTGFSWKPSIRAGSTLMLVGGDNRGNGTGGSILNVVSAGGNTDNSCLSGSSPSSTPGSPAGGSYPTSSSGATTGGSKPSSSKSKTGAIVGGVIGGIALFILFLLLLFLYRRRQKRRLRNKERPDLLNADEEDGDERRGGRTRRNELPQYYQPEPFVVPDPTVGRHSAETAGTHTGTGTGGEDPENRRPMSGGTTGGSFYTRGTTPDLYAGSSAAGDQGRAGGRKVAPRPMRPVNVIQHDDAGVVQPEGGEEVGEPETVELPPAYTALGKKKKAEGAPGVEGSEPRTEGAPAPA